MTKNPKKHLNRRDFFKIAATGGAGLAVASCSNDPVEKIIPYITPADNITLAKPYYFSTICKECPAQCGLDVKVVNARATQVKGNKNDPNSKGSICPIGSASLQSLYNPARLKDAFYNGKKLNSKEAVKKFTELIDTHRNQVLYISAGKKDSKTKLIQSLIADLGGDATDLTTLPIESIKAASKKLFGFNSLPDYKIEQADLVVNFGAEFLDYWIDHAELSNGFAKMHAIRGKKKNLFYHISSHMGLTGSNADKWISCSAGHEFDLAMACIHQIVDTSNVPASEKSKIKRFVQDYSVEAVSKRTSIDRNVLIDLTATLKNADKPLVIGGGLSSAQKENSHLQLAIHLLNYVTGAINKTVYYYNESIENEQTILLESALNNIQNKKYALVVIDDVNLIHVLPQSSAIKQALKNTEVVVLSTSDNETTQIANLVLPIKSFYESWGDAHTKNGVYKLQQPVMGSLPPYNTLDSGDIWFEIGQQLQLKNTALEQKDFKSYLAQQWLQIKSEAGNSEDFSNFWNKSLMQGFVQVKRTAASVGLKNAALESINRINSDGKQLKVVAFNSSLQNADGQTGDKPWLLEIPHPISQVVWSSWAEINPKTANEMNIKHGDEIKIKTDAGEVTLGAYVFFGVAENTIAIPAGYGRELLFPNYSQRRNAFLPFTKDEPKKLKTIKTGENVFDLLDFSIDDDSNAPYYFSGNVAVKNTKKKSDMVTMDGAQKLDLRTDPKLVNDAFGDRSQKDRVIFATATLDEIKKGKIIDENHHELRERNFTIPQSDNPSEAYEKQEEVVQKDFFGHKGKGQDKIKYHDPYRFEMVIDLEKCTGCSACIVACYAENNVPVVGKERVALGRSMAWIRIERFFDQNEETKEYTQTNFGPTMCQQCDNAGCEPVCPVYATYHNPDGLNAQVYNRCIGTRYCSNNCVYKQRKFNWRSYEFPYPASMQLNPDVTVREKGVMEKCTFCAQRIRSKKEEASMQGRLVGGDEIQTACQSACPTNAIQFGNGQDEKSTVNRLKDDIRAFKQLENLNFKPAITYLRKIVPSDTNVV